MKRYLYLSVAVFSMTVAAAVGYHLAINTAHAEALGAVAAYTVDNNGGHLVMLDNGDVYFRWPDAASDPFGGHPIYRDDDRAYQMMYVGNFWGGKKLVPSDPQPSGETHQ